MKHIFIIDPKTFHGQQWKMDGLFDSIGQYFRTQEKPDFSTSVVKYPREAIGLIQKQLDKTNDTELVRVYAIGGDSILYDCLNGIAGLPDMELAIVPHGAANSFIRSFGEGTAELFNDIQSITTAPVIPTDMIAVGNNYAINGCTVGFIPAVAVKMRDINAKFEKGLSRFSTGFWSFLINLTSIFNKHIVTRHYKITIDGNDYSGNYSLVTIVNGPYFGQKKNALKEVMPNDGFLDVVLIKSAGTLATLRAFRKYSRGKLTSQCVRMQAQHIEIQSDAPMWIQTDNEYLLDTSITFKIIPEAVQVVAVNNLTYQTEVPK